MGECGKWLLVSATSGSTLVTDDDDDDDDSMLTLPVMGRRSVVLFFTAVDWF